MNRPRLFIGSSAEAIDVAHAIQENLQHDALCRVWDQGIFGLTGSVLDDLLAAAADYDFAVLVLQPDDIVHIRHESLPAPRDNIVFELGLFVAQLGKDRVFLLAPKDDGGMRFPTDLVGSEPGRYAPPDRPDDLLAALGPFCNQVRREMRHLGARDGSMQIRGASDTNSVSPADEAVAGHREKRRDAAQSTIVESDVVVDPFGNYTISVKPSVFFDNRICTTFPGVRGATEFTNPQLAVDRLMRLLRPPTAFETAHGYGVHIDPIWWWRGCMSMQIESARRLSETRWLMDNHELEIEKLMVYRGLAYYKQFVYVEARADSPTGLYDADPSWIERVRVKHGFTSEEYALFHDTPITRACYDDGSAEIDGEIVSLEAAQLRVRYLTPYNFVIAPKFCAFNMHELESEAESLLNGMLQGQATAEDLVSFVEAAPRHPKDE